MFSSRVPPTDPAADPLERAGFSTAAAPEALLKANGWDQIAEIDSDMSDALLQGTVHGFVLRAWPAAVRLSHNPATNVLRIWTHPDPHPLFVQPGFPSPAAIQNALRTIVAVAIARADSFALYPSLGREVTKALEIEQQHFEAVAAALDASSYLPAASRAA